MYFQHYYCIHGNDKLLSNNAIEEDVRNILAEPLIIVNYENGHTQTTQEDYEAYIKILFLIYMNKSFIHSFISESPISVEFFDQWWQVKSCDTPIPGSDVLENVDSSITNKIQLTGRDLADSFIGNLIKR